MALGPNHIGYTGTRNGMTRAQILALVQYLMAFAHDLAPGLRPTLHHGCCVGGDEQAAMIARRLGFHVIGHPPTDTRWKMGSFENDGDRPPLPYLDRNRRIVLETVQTVGTPREMGETQRGGTWYTIRFSRKEGHPTHVILPTGELV